MKIHLQMVNSKKFVTEQTPEKLLYFSECCNLSVYILLFLNQWQWYNKSIYSLYNYFATSSNVKSTSPVAEIEVPTKGGCASTTLLNKDTSTSLYQVAPITHILNSYTNPRFPNHLLSWSFQSS